MSRKVWQKAFIEKTKAVVREEIQQSSNTPKKRLNYILRRINETIEEGPEQRLRRYIYCVSALVHHAKYGGLRRGEIRKLSTIAEFILKVHEISSESRRLGFLYGDLYLALSQAYRWEGDQWGAVWAQQLGRHLSRRAPSGGSGHQALSLGVRSMRLGQTEFAIRCFKEAEEQTLGPRQLARARLETIKANRLLGRVDQSLEILNRTLKEVPLDEAERQEADWERLCIQSLRTKDISILIPKVLKGNSHHSYHYILEVFLLTRAIESREYLKRFSSAKKMAMNSSLNPKDLGFFYEAVQVIEKCYNYEISYFIRLRQLGDLLAQTRRLLSIDKELLVWAAAARFLHRSSAKDLAPLVTSQYRSLSLMVSGGQVEDPFGVVGDLIQTFETKVTRPRAA